MSVAAMFDSTHPYRTQAISSGKLYSCSQCSEVVDDVKSFPCSHSFCSRCAGGSSNNYCAICFERMRTIEPSSLQDIYKYLPIHQSIYDTSRSRNSSLSESIPLNLSSSSDNILSQSPPSSLQSYSPIISLTAYENRIQRCPESPPVTPNLSTLRDCVLSETFNCSQCFAEEFSCRCETCGAILCISCSKVHDLSHEKKNHVMGRISSGLQISRFQAAVGSEIRSSNSQTIGFRSVTPMSSVTLRNFDDILATSSSRSTTSSSRPSVVSSSSRSTVVEETTETRLTSSLDIMVRQALEERSSSTTAASIFPEKTTKTESTCGHELSEYYCTSCNSVICMICNCQHKNHGVTTVQSLQEQLQSTFQSISRCIGTRIKDIDNTSNSIAKTIPAVDSVGRELEKKIELSFNNLLAILLNRKSSMLSKLSSVVALKKEKLLTQKGVLMEEKNKYLRMHNDMINSSGECMTIVQQLKLNEKLQSAMESLELVQAYLSPHEDAWIAFNAPIQEAHHNLSIFGSLDSIGHADQTYAFGINTNFVIAGTKCQISIQSVAHSGENRTSGGDDIKAVIWYDQRISKSLDVKDHGTGIYTVLFYPTDSINHKINISLRNQNIRGSPFSPNIIRMPHFHTRCWPTLQFNGNNPPIQRPWGIHCDRDGRIYVTDRGNHCIHIFEHDGSLFYRFGEFGTLPGQFNRPAGITVDANRRIIVTDKDNHRVQIFSCRGKLLTYFGQMGSLDGDFFYPWGIDCDHRTGRIVVADTRNHRVQIFSSTGIHEKSLGHVSCSKELDTPRGVLFGPEGQIYVTDFNHHRLLIINKDLNWNTVRKVGYGGVGSYCFFRPQGIAIDHFKRLLIVDTRNYRVKVYSLEGKYISSFAMGGAGISPMESPGDIALSPIGQVYIADILMSRIFRF